MRRIIAILLLAAVLCGCGVACDTGVPPPGADEDIGELYRDITVYRQNGEAVRLSDFIGVPIVMNFWATWCPPCVIEMPYFSKVDNEIDEVLFLMVNLTDGVVETPEKVEAFLEDSGLKFNNILLDLDGEAMAKYEIEAIPTTLFINEEGRIVNTKIGMLTEDELRQEVAVLLRRTV